jgi:ubiquinone/menaquinone biosynthesis C-methylase UbiE
MIKNDYKLQIGEKYIPEKYWKDRSIPNSSVTESISKVHRDFLVKNLHGKHRIFELGPGDGRLFKLYSNKNLDTLDLSENHFALLQAKAIQFNINLSQSYYNNAMAAFPFDNKQFEIAVASQVLIHIPFSFIDHTINELLRVSQSLIIISGKTDKWPKCESEVHPHSHCFLHDYLSILQRKNVIVDQIFEDDSTIVLVCSEKSKSAG